MMSFWRKLTGELIVDSNGHPILCDHCPCKVVIPAGTTITYTLTRTVTRAKDYKAEQMNGSQIASSNRDQLDWTWTHTVNASYTTTADINVGEGVWIVLIDSSKGTATSTFEGNGNGTKTEWNPMTSAYDSQQYTAVMQQPQQQDIPYVRAYLQPVDENGTMVLKWTQYYCSHSRTVASNYSNLKWTPVPTRDQIAWLVDPGSDSYTETVTGGTGQKGNYQQTITVTSMDLETGQAVANLTANASCNFTETFGTSVGTQMGTDSVNDVWTASWTMAMPPCENCQGI